MGPPVKYEPNNLDAMHAKKKVFAIFWRSRWIEYLQILNGFYEEMTF